jgi:hypothetical protein
MIQRFKRSALIGLAAGVAVVLGSITISEYIVYRRAGLGAALALFGARGVWDWTTLFPIQFAIVFFFITIGHALSERYRQRRANGDTKSGTKIQFRVKDDEVLFENWSFSSDDPADFIKKLEGAFDAVVHTQRFLVFVIRYEFAIDEEKVVLSADEDGWAVISFAKNSTSVQQKIVDCLRSSPDFDECSGGE